MYKIQFDSEKFKQLLDEKGLSQSAVARAINSNSVQMWRLTSGKHTTSTAFLERLVPIFGVKVVADLINNPAQRSAYLATRPRKFSAK